MNFKKHITTKNVSGVVVSILIGVCVYLYGQYSDKQLAIQKFTREANEYTNKIEQEFYKYKTVLKGLQAYIVTNPDVSMPEFRQYIDSLEILKNYPGFKSLNYAIDVQDEEKEAYQNKLRKDMQNYLLNNPILLKKVLKRIDENSKNFSKHNEHFMIYYQEPIENSLFSVGRDIGDRDINYYNMLQMKKTGHAIQSGTLFKAKDNDNKDFWAMGFRLPVFKNKENIDTYLGSVGVALNFAKVITSADKNNQFLIKVYENSQSNSQVIYTNELEKNPINDFTYTGIFDVENHLFKIQIYAKNPKQYSSENTLWLIISLLSSISFFGLWLAYGTLISSNIKAHALAKEMTKDLKNMAWYDSLTKTINRNRFIEVINEDLKKGNLMPFSLYFIDLDGFKKINDTLGHNAGDIVLREYSNRLIELTKQYQFITIARMGGDEFVLKIDGENKDVEKWINLLNEAVKMPFIINNHNFLLSQSIGVSFYPKDGNDNETLLRKADMAMYAAKKQKGNAYFIYTEKLGNDQIAQNNFENDLLNAIKNKELSLVYQPQMKKEHNGYKICGLEVLCRWDSPVWGSVSPNKFISIAEENNFLEDITKWLIKEVCQQIKIWNQEISLSINISGRQFLNKTLALSLIEIIHSQNVSSKNFTIEITELTIMKEPELAKEIIKLFRDNGIKISIDDFGNGYSSFSYLNSFDIDEIKIDKIFVQQSQANKTSKDIVIAIINMSHQLGLKVVAEGIETQEELDFLNENSCDVLQGFYFSTPVTSENVIRFFN